MRFERHRVEAKKLGRPPYQSLQKGNMSNDNNVGSVEAFFEKVSEMNVPKVELIRPYVFLRDDSITQTI